MGLFLASLTQPAFCTDGKCAPTPFGGLIILVVGWVGIGEGGANFTWLSNPSFLVAWVMSMVAWIVSLPQRASLISMVLVILVISFAFSALAVILSASFLLFTEVTIGTSGSSNAIFHLHIGYWLWLSSMIVMLVGNGVQLIVLHNKQELQLPQHEMAGSFQRWRRI